VARKILGINYYRPYKKIKAINTPMLLKARFQSNAAARIFFLHQTLERQATAVSDKVDYCHQAINQRIEEFFQSRLDRISIFVDLIIERKVFDQDAFYNNILSRSDLDILVKELRNIIQRETEKHFGAVAFVNMHYGDYGVQGNIHYIDGLIQEYLRTMHIIESSEELISQSYREYVDQFKVFFLVKKLAKKMKPGESVLKMVDCCPKQNVLRVRQTMISQIAGILNSVQRKLAKDTCRMAAISFYELYDVVWELHYEKEIEKVKKRMEHKSFKKETRCCIAG